MFELKGVYWFHMLGFFAQASLLLCVLYRLGTGHLAQRWLVLMCLFVGTALLKADQLWAGLLCLVAVFLVWKHLHHVYAGEIRPRFLIGSGLISGFLLGGVFHSGLALALGLGLFSVLHCFLHEREEKNISYGQVSNREVWHRWLRLWGAYWLLPLGLASVISFGMDRFSVWEALFPVGMFQAMVPSGKTANGFGYFSTFHQEFLGLFTVSYRLSLFLIVSVILALQLVLLGLFPVLGILGLGYQVPNRFVYRLLQRPDEELLLIFIAGTSLILGTLWHSTSDQITSYGPLAMLMGFLVMTRWLQVRPRLEQFVYLSLWFLSLLCLLCLFGMIGFYLLFLLRLHG